MAWKKKKKKKKAKKRGIKTDFFPLALEEFEDYVISFLDRRIRHYAMSHTINYCGMLEYHPMVVRFIQQYPEEFGNLFNDMWWRSQQNEEEIEMRKHPNRSSQWVGNRLEKQRNDLINDLFRNIRSVTPPRIIELDDDRLISLCRLCGSQIFVESFDVNGFCRDCWDRHIIPYLREFIAYALDSNPN